MTRWLAMVDRLSVWLGTLAGVALTGLALFTVVDIVLRYLFNQPIAGSIDVIKLSLIVMTFCALPYAGRSDGHIVVDIVPDYPSPRVTAIRDAIGKLLVAFVFALLAWQGWVRADEAALFGAASNMLEIPFRPFFFVMSFCSAVYALALLLEGLLRFSGRSVPALKDGLDADLSGARGIGRSTGQ